MGKKIQHKRGLKQDLPMLATSELGYTTDTEQLFVGTNNMNIRLLDEKDKAETDARLTNFERVFDVSDPISNINNVEILCAFPARGESQTTWVQSISINEKTNEIYAAFQENNGNYLRIEIRNMNGTFKESKTLPIAKGAFTENLSFFYNNDNQLCFIVRTQNRNTYSIYNYVTEELSTPVEIKGDPFKGYAYDNYFVTCDTTNISPYKMDTLFIYSWDSIKNGTPNLLQNLVVERLGTALVEKIQGIVVNGGYYFFPQGQSNGTPALTIYNNAGQLVNTFLYNKESLAKVVNKFYPNAIPEGATISYENESGCVYKGRLALVHIINSTAYVFIHNSPVGDPLSTKIPIHRRDTGYVDTLAFYNGATPYAEDTKPQARRIGNIIELSGAIKGITSMNIEVFDFGGYFAPRRNIQFTAPTSNGYTCNWQIQPNGKARIMNTRHPTPDDTTWYPFSFTWTI